MKASRGRKESGSDQGVWIREEASARWTVGVHHGQKLLVIGKTAGRGVSDYRGRGPASGIAQPRQGDAIRGLDDLNPMPGSSRGGVDLPAE